MKWVLHKYELTIKDRLTNLMRAYQTLVFPFIWTITEDGKSASYKLYYFGDWLACIQHDFECAILGHWYGYSLEGIDGEPTIYTQEILQMIDGSNE
jgi:hypothetical protein